MLQSWKHSGFNVHRSRRVQPDEREDLERRLIDDCRMLIVDWRSAPNNHQLAIDNRQLLIRPSVPGCYRVGNTPGLMCIEAGEFNRMSGRIWSGV